MRRSRDRREGGGTSRRQRPTIALRHILRGRPEGLADRELRFWTHEEAEAAMRRRRSAKKGRASAAPLPRAGQIAPKR